MLGRCERFWIELISAFSAEGAVIMSKRQEESRPTDQNRKKHSRELSRDTHDPIIITGGSMFLNFDGPVAEEYTLANAANPTRFVSKEALLIAGVEVVVDGSTHVCAGVPSHGRCTVVIQGKRSRKPDSAITVTGSDQAITIEFDNKEYEKGSTATHRKKFGHKNRKVKSLTIKDNVTGTVHNCMAVPPNGKCDVVVHDRHRI
jgi:hypothetical protein